MNLVLQASRRPRLSGIPKQVDGGLLATGGDPLARSWDPLSTGGDPLARSWDPLATGGNPLLARSGDPLATGGDPLAKSRGPLGMSGDLLEMGWSPPATAGDLLATTWTLVAGGGPLAMRGVLLEPTRDLVGEKPWVDLELMANLTQRQ